jgi:hypothetical protein
MDYKDFRGRHAGGKIIVCGLGTSLPLLENPQDYVTIGVNDIGRIMQPNYLVVVNDHGSFTKERWSHIHATTVPHVFSHINTLNIDDKSKIVHMRLGKYGSFDWDSELVSYTSNSPYIGVLIAGYMGASKIGVIGVDFTPDHFFAKSGEHTLSRKLNTINREYQMMYRAMENRGIRLVNLSPTSLIDIPREKLCDF